MSEPKPSTEELIEQIRETLVPKHYRNSVVIADRLQSQADELKGHREKWGGPTISAHPAMLEQVRQNNELHAEIKTQADVIALHKEALQDQRDKSQRLFDLVQKQESQICEMVEKEVEVYEPQEAKLTIATDALKKVIEDNHSLGNTSPSTLNSIEEALKQIEKGQK